MLLKTAHLFFSQLVVLLLQIYVYEMLASENPAHL